MEKTLTKSLVAVGNRSPEPLFAMSQSVVSNDKYWRWGDDNLMPTALSLMSRRSTTHRRIINDKADYIAGKGFSYDEQQPLLRALVARANGEGDTLRSVVCRLAFDKALMGNAFMEVVTDEQHSFLSFYHQDASRCRLSRNGEHLILHHDWSRFTEQEARTLPLYPRFEKMEDGSLRSVVHYKEYEPMFSHYGVPKYIAGMGVSAIAYKTDCWNISRLDNSFQLSGVMMLDASIDNEAEAERIVQAAERRFAGNPGQVMFVVREGQENDNSRFIPVESRNEGDWSELHDQATSDIVIAHSWFRSLSGLDYSAGFSAERILHEYEVALNTVILAEQEELLAPVKRIIGEKLGVDASSLEIINRPPTRSKPIYMKVWEARKADGLEYDPDDEEQQAFLSQITKYNVTKIG
ncbi:MAG: phage portal protein [Alistipes sp.]|nr:phage portal protein [Alistipes sp.]